MTIEQALHELGVRDDTLTRQEKASLDERGYVFLHGMVTRGQAERMLAEMHAIFARERIGQEGGQADCAQLQNKSDAYDICVTHPRLLAAVYHVLRADFVSQGVHSRPNPPGKGQQGLHQDGGMTTPGRYETCNSIWPLADFTVENGATRVVPGSHREGKEPSGSPEQLLGPHPQEVRLIAPVGSVAVFNGQLWHSAMPNHSRADRPNVTSFWGRRPTKAFDATLTEETSRRLSPAARRLFPAPTESMATADAAT
jgi:ectoine hydroxylase-related dioxygenase (phytanoyl-CoA dioxygenase family)